MAYGTLKADVIQSDTAGVAPQFNDGNGTQTGTLCRAWVNFNGTGTVAIRASFNVSSITDNGTGNYTVNFTTALADANYSVCNSQYGYDFPSSIVANNLAIQSLTTGSFRLLSTGITNAAVDVDQIHAAVFR